MPACVRTGIGFRNSPWYLSAMFREPTGTGSRGAEAPYRRLPGRAMRSRRLVSSGGRPRRAGVAAFVVATGVVATGMCLASGVAIAGDFYLRGGIGFDRPGRTAFIDIDCSSTAPAALYGCGTGGDGTPYRSVGEFGTVPAVELGLGYAAGTARFELLIEYRPRFAFEGRANFLAPGQRESVSARLSSVSGMLAGFVDLAALGVPKPGPFAPFVGAGVGAVHTRIGKTTMTFPATATTVPGGSRVGLAWMVSAGVAVALDERVTFDLAWRYTDLGEVRTDRGPGRVVWRDGSREPLPLELAPT